MSDASITYFPVGNGDTTLIQLSDGASIIVDCNVTEPPEDESDEPWYDVHEHLRKVLTKDNDGTSHADAFILTHPEQDHCRRFAVVFYTGDPANYSEEDRKAGRILIDELWFTPCVFSRYQTDLCDDAKDFRKEARRRMKLYREGKDERSAPGNRLRIIGFTKNPDLEGLEEIVSVPGNSINLINGSRKDDFAFFVHAPFEDDSDSDDGDRNDTSVVLHARFDVEGIERAALAFFGGDSPHQIWARILDRSEDEHLEWDLFLAPHHCSWTFFNEVPYDDNKTPAAKSLLLLAKHRTNAVVVASCKPIKDDKDNPPHYPAAEEYRKVVGDKNFLPTMEYPSEEKPEPLTFEIRGDGRLTRLIAGAPVAVTKKVSRMPQVITKPNKPWGT